MAAPAPAAAVPAFREIVDSYGSHVWRMLRYLGVREADIEDAAQEVFMIVHRRLHELQQPGALRAWISSICVGVASNARRSQRRRREELVEQAPEAAASHASPDTLVERKREREMLLEVLAQLDDEKREVFVLFELEDLDMDEVASLLGCPLKTAYSRLYAARRIVTQQLESRLERSGA